MESLALGDVSKYGGVNRKMIVEDAVKVGSKHCHVFLVIGGKFTICHLHCHLNLLFMVDSSTSSKKTDIFPRNMWIQSHVMNFGAKVRSPACFCNEHLVLDIFIETLELDTHGVNNRWWEASGGTKGVKKLVAFFYGWGKLLSIELEPVITSWFDKESCLFTCVFDSVIEFLIWHVSWVSDIGKEIIVALLGGFIGRNTCSPRSKSLSLNIE